MKANRKFLLLVILASAFCIATATLSGRVQTREQDEKKSNSAAQRLADEGSTPVVNQAAEGSVSKGKRVRQQVRKKRRNLPIAKDDPAEASRFKITEESQSAFGGPSSHAPKEAALPIDRSDAVLIGEVADAQAFLSEDETTIFSEFTVRVDEVLKPFSGTSLYPGASITVAQGGGAIRFPSGKIVERGFIGKPFPSMGKRYLFFLKYNEEGQDFPIITAYQLRDGRVYPLFGLTQDGEVLPTMEAYQQYRGVEEATFINDVRNSIAQTPPNVIGEGRIQ